MTENNGLFNPWWRLVATTLVLLTGTASAQTAAQLRILDASAISGGEARILVSASDSSGRELGGLGPANFTAQIDGAPAAIARVARASEAGKPLTLILALDISGSMNGPGITAAVKGARALIEQLGPRDQCALLTFGSEVREVSGLSTDRAGLLAALAGLKAKDSHTLLYSALFEALDRAARAPTARSAVVVLTDGKDDGSTITLEDVLTKAAVKETPIFALAYGGADLRLLQRLAEVSKGAFFHAPGAEDVVSSFRAIAESLQRDYLLYIQTPAKAGAYSLSLKLDYRGQSALAALDVGGTSVNPGTAPVGGIQGQQAAWRVWVGLGLAGIAFLAGAGFWLRRKRQHASAIALTMVPPRVWVEVLKGADAGQRFMVLPGDSVIGREARQCQIVLKNDPLVGREHARISENAQGQYTLADLGSQNGTCLNEVRIDKAVALQNNDRILVGLSELLFIDQR